MSVQERTYIMIKVCQILCETCVVAECHLVLQPDGVQRGLVGTIISRFEARGFKLIAMKFVQATTEHLEKRMFSTRCMRDIV